MNFQWDESKRQINLRKHGIDFADVAQIFDGYTISVEDGRFDYPETRYITIGMLRSMVIVVVIHTFEEDDIIRIISARKATKHEEKRYFE
jgi:uncharacterized DUF497 family protein